MTVDAGVTEILITPLLLCVLRVLCG